MAKMNYNPEDRAEGGGGGGQRAQPGTYAFCVNDANETTFRSGNQGIKIKMDVAAFEDRDVTCFDNFVYVPQALWKLEQFLTALGLDFNDPPSVDHLIGREGKAKFILGEERDGRRYLEVDEFLEPTARRPGSGPGNMQPQPASRPNDNTAGPEDDDVPF